MQEQEEIWKDVVGYEGCYQISNLGRVKSLPRKKVLRERILKQGLDKDGYFCVALCKSTHKTTKVHQLVAMAFLDHKPCGMKLVVNHKDFIRTNNCVENLEIVTSRENTNLKHLKSTSQYTGVCWYKQCDKWMASIKIGGKQNYLGLFEREYDAHLAYQKALSELILAD